MVPDASAAIVLRSAFKSAERFAWAASRLIGGALSIPEATVKARSVSCGLNDPAAAMETLLRAAGEPAAVSRQSSITLFHAEQQFLARKTLVPLLALPRAYAVSPRVRDFQLNADGTPDLASASLEDAP